MSTVVFLGAGFSRLAGVPLARQLFDTEPVVDRISRQRLVNRVRRGWLTWHQDTAASPEQYLAYLEHSAGREWRDAVWYVGLIVALRMGRVEAVGGRTTITRHNINRTSGVAAQEDFWTSVFRRAENVSVITTNFDILAERGLRNQPRPRMHRPGFHYGLGAEYLEGGGYPSYAHIHRIAVRGAVPLFKLHGSVSWSIRKGKIVRYHDCRPAIRGDAMIVAPIVEKRVPAYLGAVWDAALKALATARTVLIVGYSLPSYDQRVVGLLRGISDRASVHVFDPDAMLVSRYQNTLQRAIVRHKGLPEGTAEIGAILS
ncbi:MAG: SIR2 family protein [Candidatus Dormibacteraeota bacterium]|nr:SIR2 family protein [Candidatus Dormibacteraeota bacterium]